MGLEFDLEIPRRDFDLSLKGCFGNGSVGIFGPSGAGKTTLFRLLAGLEEPERGRIVLNGRVLTDVEKRIALPAQKRRIGVVFQENRIFPHLSVRENLLFGYPYAPQKRISLDEVVELLDLAPLLASMPHRISGGEQQRTAIGRALLTSPELLLLDEPFNAVDSSLRTKMLPYLKRLREELRIPMLVISHDLPDIQRLTGDLYLIDRGKCRGYGTLLDLFRREGSLPGDPELINSFELFEPQKIEPGLYSCSVLGMPGGKIRIPSAASGRFRAVISPKDIALSRRPVRDISLQNQIPGVIDALLFREEKVLCLIDAGVRLAVELTPCAVRDMALRDGLDVYCLFKAHALRY